MRKPLKSIDSESRARINDAVAAAQKYAGVEILPVVAKRSGTDESAQAFAGWFLAMILVGAALGVEAPSWLFFALMTVGFFGGMRAAEAWPGLRRWFAQSADQRRAVREHAEALLYDLRHRKTRGAALILYASLEERWAAVRATSDVREAVGQEFLAEVEDVLVGKVFAGRAAEGFVEAARALGERLAVALPRAAVDAGVAPAELVVVSSGESAGSDC